LFITALGLYDATLNGLAVGDDVLSPGWTDFRKRVRYRAYDVTKMIHPGRNAIAVILGDGWFCGNLEVVGRQFYGDRPKLLAQLQIDFEDGTQQRVVTNKTWKTAFGPILESDLQMGESYDARLEFEGWDLPGFNDNQWQNVEVFPDTGVKKVGINSPMIKRIQELSPVSDPTEIFGWPSSKWIYDFGQNMVDTCA
jgi:alpha-L-rhamnosidase